MATYGVYQYTSDGAEWTTTKKARKRKLKFYLRCIKWLWNNREWENTRQKYKAMERECGI